ncbi:MAG: DUF3488 domain-containing protein [Opitutae bacterium]|nr:DUF3488 domain-containing protein [Opitutae bacterium]
MSGDNRLPSVARPQLNLDELRRFKWLLGGLLALVSLWTVFFLDVEALALVGIAGGAILAALVWPQLPSRVPALVWRLAVPGIIAAMVTDWYFSKETLPVLIRLGVLLVLYRGISYRRQREDLQLIVLGLFLIVVAGVLTVSLGFAFLLLLFTACALAFLFVITLIDMTENTRVALTYAEMSQCPAWARGGWGRLFRQLRAVADWRLLTFAAGLFVVVVGFSAVLFLVIPRFEFASGFFLDRYITRKSHTGFTESVKFGDVGELIRDESVAMRVDVTDAAAIRDVPYWRLVVLDEYTPQGFKVSLGLKNSLLRTQRVAQVLKGRNGPVFTSQSVGGVWIFYVEPGVSRFLPLPGSFGALRLRDVVPVQQSFSNQLVALRTEAMTMTAFQLEGVELGASVPDLGLARRLPDLQARAAAPAPADERTADPRLTLRGPQGAANEAALARMVQEISGGAKLDALEFARRATTWLHGRHAYSLSVRIPRGEGDDIVRWLGSNEPGFCEYFAAGLTVLCRAAGHPARVIAGFHGGARNAFENYFMVKNADAHAWVEVFDGTGAWVRQDPTPGSPGATETGAAQAVQQERDSSWSARFDSLRVIWYRRIVNFDARQQVQMFDDVKSFTTDTGSAMRARLESLAKRFRAWLAGPWNWQRAAKSLGLLTGAVALGWMLWQFVRWGWQRWQLWRHPGELDPVRREAGRQLGRLREQRAEDGEQTPEARGRRPEDVRIQDEIGTIIAELQRLRYGRRETWPEPGAVFKRARRARRLARRE